MKIKFVRQQFLVALGHITFLVGYTDQYGLAKPPSSHYWVDCILVYKIQQLPNGKLKVFP
jgi:hypothetical protein